MNGIQVKNLTKNYGKNCALKNINLTFTPNKIYGLLGKNGAGKSTLLNIIANRIFATSGEILFDNMSGVNNNELGQQLYMTSEATYYPESARVQDVFNATKTFYRNFDMEYALKISDMFELNTYSQVKALSTGFNSILKLICALSVNVQYLLLDEPVLGLDANNRDLFYRLMLEKYVENSCTIVLSTHLIEEVANVIENIIIIKKGEILYSESCESLLQQCYAVSGIASAVDAFIKGKNVLSQSVLGELKTAYVQGEKEQATQGLDITAVDLQKLVILMTNNKGAL